MATNYAPHLIAGLFLFAAFTSSDGCYNSIPEPAALTAAAPPPAHVCIDSTHRDCDGMCICDGMECPGMKPNKITQREYQFDVDQEGYYLYDGQKYLGYVPYGTSPVLDSIINKDNE